MIRTCGCAEYLLSTRADGLLLFDGSLDTNRLHGIGQTGVALPLVAAYDELPDAKINSVITDNRARRQARRAAPGLRSGTGASAISACPRATRTRMSG